MFERMRVLHVIDSGGLYGAEIMLLHLVAEQIRLGLSPTICSIGEPHLQEKPLESEAIGRGFSVNKLRMRPGLNPFAAFQILKLAHQGAFDLIHSHGYKGNVLLGFIPEAIRRTPLICTVHGYTSPRGLHKQRLYEWLDGKALTHLDRVVVVSAAMLAHPRLQQVDRGKARVIPNGISPDNPLARALPADVTPNLDPQAVAFCQQGFTIGAIGRLSEEKAFDHLIEAVHLLITGGADLRLLILGEGGKRPELEALVARLGLAHKVLMPGYRRAAHNYLPFFDIFTLSSRTEGLPITILEAMFAGIPIVATRVGGIPDVIEDLVSGLLVPAAEPKQLANAFRKLYSDEALSKRLSLKATSIACQEYTSAIMAERYLALYRELV